MIGSMHDVVSYRLHGIHLVFSATPTRTCGSRAHVALAAPACAADTSTIPGRSWLTIAGLGPVQAIASGVARGVPTVLRLAGRRVAAHLWPTGARSRAIAYHLNAAPQGRQTILDMSIVACRERALSARLIATMQKPTRA